MVSAAAALDLHDNITVKEYVIIFLTTNEIRAALICWPGLYTFFQNSYLVTGWKYGLWIHKPMPRDVVKRAKNHLKKVIGISIVLSISVIKTWQYYSILLCLHVVMLCTTCTILQQIYFNSSFSYQLFLEEMHKYELLWYVRPNSCKQLSKYRCFNICLQCFDTIG